MNGTWFNLPNGGTATELEVTVPVVGRVKVTSGQVADLEQLKQTIVQYQEKIGYRLHGTLNEMLRSCLNNQERQAAEALEGAKSVRDDMLVYLRAACIVAESICSEHLNHSQKNERIRGLIGCIERSIQGLREEKFNFKESLWRRGRDLFRWDENERYLRERVQELEAELAGFKGETKSETGVPF